MKHHSQIPIWELRRRQKFLREFRSLVDKYFSDSRPADIGSGMIEGKIAKSLRPEINHRLSTAQLAIYGAGIDPTITYTPPPAIGGYIQKVNVFANIFNLSQFGLDRDNVIDNIDVTLGIYADNECRAWVRTCNPLYWLGQFLDWIASIPFKLLGRVGFDESRIEKTFLGRSIRLVFYLLGGFASLLTVLQLLQLLDPILKYFKVIIIEAH